VANFRSLTTEEQVIYLSNHHRKLESTKMKTERFYIKNDGVKTMLLSFDLR
jgi:hypothetical protein